MVSCSSNQHMHAMVSPPPSIAGGSGHPFAGGGMSDLAHTESSSAHHHSAGRLGSTTTTPQRGSGGHHHVPPTTSLAGHGGGVGPPPPTDFPPSLLPPPLLRPMPPPQRHHPPPPFFIREIYKNGFLKRLPYNEKKSSALAKLMKTDRFWVVFSIHDDIHPFLELWHEPTEVANRPPVHIFPLAACQHISTSIVPAGDSEWSFVINFDMAVAIRFSCNSREVMVDWVEVIRTKLSEMGILNPRGNLYSRTPLGPPVTKPVIRDPTSPLPQPPPLTTSVATATQTATASAGDETVATTGVGATASSATTAIKTADAEATEASNSQSNYNHHHQATTTTTAATVTTTPTKHYHPPSTTTTSTTTTTRTKAVIETHPSSTAASSSFTTSIYLNRKTSLPTTASSTTTTTPNHKTKVSKSVSSMLDVKIASSTEFGKNEGNVGGGGGATSSVYLNQSSPTRHVTVIPVNSGEAAAKENEEEKAAAAPVAPLADLVTTPSPPLAPSLGVVDNHTYGAIFPMDEGKSSNGGGEKLKKNSGSGGGSRTELKSPVRRQLQSSSDMKTATTETSPTRRGRERTTARSSTTTVATTNDEPPPLPERPIALMRRLSDRKHHEAAGEGRPSNLSSNVHNTSNIQNKNNNNVRRKARRSSSLGPFLADRSHHNSTTAQMMTGCGGGTPNDLVVGASTLSLESVDSNPRQAVPRAEGRRHGHGGGGLGAIPRRPLLLHASFSPRPTDTTASGNGGLHEPLAASNSLSSPSRPANDHAGGISAGLRPPFYHHPLVAASPSVAATGGFPPMVPLPGLTCQLSMPPG